MTMYCFYQETEKSRWLPALASERDNIIKTKKPALVSVLDVDNDFSADLTVDERKAVKYSGPFYVDFDAADLNEATQQFQKFLTNLKAKGVDLEMLRLYATGKKGYHIEIPASMLMAKIPPGGVPNLPHIYREIAHQLYVDTLDLRVYSAGRGRMWRCMNVKRDNDKFKVQISVDEAFTMSAENYMQVCSSPRSGMPVEPAVLNPELGLLFASARDKVERSAAKTKVKAKDTEALKRFKGEWPETLQLLLQGEGLKEDVGWNYISLQLATTASALGKSEDQLLEDAAPLINGHKGDSARYNTASKRREDLRQMYRYTNGNPCYDFSTGGVMALLIPEIRANADISFGEYTPETPAEPVVKEDGTTEAVANDEISDSSAENVRVNKHGIFVRADEGYKKICDVGVAKPISLRKLDGDYIGYEVETFVDGLPEGKKNLPMAALTTKAQFNAWTMNSSGAPMLGSDGHTLQLANMLRKRAKSTNSVVYALEREGVDLVVPPGCKDRDGFEIVWASPSGVISQGTTQYRFHGAYSDDGYTHTDLMLAPELSEEDGAFIDDLLTINTEQNLAKLLGWFVAATLTQLIRKELKQFPLLQCFGQAESGKSATIEMLNGMYYYMHKPRQIASSGQTFFPILMAVATSSSLPIVFEEMKPRQMAKHMKDAIQNIFRGNYRGDIISRGSLGRDKAVREPTVTDFANAAPIAFVGEAIEDQSAILGRCVVVSLSQADRRGRKKQFDRCQEKYYTMGKIGKALVLSALTLKSSDVGDMVRANLKRITANLSEDAQDSAMRPTFNLAVVLTGLDFMKHVLSLTFGDRFNAKFDSMQSAVVGNVQASIPRNLSEASRVVDVMAQLSRNADPQYQLVKGVDYTLGADGSSIDLKLRNSYAKYVKWQRSMGMEVLFDTESAFITGMANYGGTTHRACPDNDQLFDSPKAVVYRLSTAYLDKENVDSFRD